MSDGREALATEISGALLKGVGGSLGSAAICSAPIETLGHNF
jgi:hypothetical protein